MESILLVEQASSRTPAAAEPGGSPRAPQTPLWKSLSGFLIALVHFPCIFSASQGPEVELPPA